MAKKNGRRTKRRREKRVRKKKDFITLLVKTLKIISSHRVFFLPFAALCCVVLAQVTVQLNHAIAFVVWLIAIFVACDMYKDIPTKEGKLIAKGLGKFGKTKVIEAEFTEEK